MNFKIKKIVICSIAILVMFGIVVYYLQLSSYVRLTKQEVSEQIATLFKHMEKEYSNLLKEEGSLLAPATIEERKKT